MDSVVARLPRATRWAAAFAALCLVVTLLAQEPETQPASRPEKGQPPRPPLAVTRPKTELPAGVLARIDGKDVTEQDLMRYTYRKTGMREFLDLVDELLVEKKAAALGVSVAEEELEAEVERSIQSEIERLRGDREHFLANLARQFYTLESYRRRLLDALRPKRLLDRCILKSRSIQEQDLRERFEQLYGEAGVLTQIRQIMIAKQRAEGVAAADLAREVMAKLEKDAALFPKLVEEYSDHAPSKRNGGMIPNYRPGRGPRSGSAGEAFDEAVRGLAQEGQIAGPVESEVGFHIVQLVKRTTTRFEDVKNELRMQLEKAPPSSSEIIDFKRRLRAEATVEM